MIREYDRKYEGEHRYIYELGRIHERAERVDRSFRRFELCCWVYYCALYPAVLLYTYLR